jgi:predicted 2-oxoglutarate/Fe(II)-dependent dioxygenase YbiX
MTSSPDAPCALVAQGLGAGVFTIDGFLSGDECSAYIARGETLGYEVAAVQTDRGERIVPDVRNNDRVLHDDPVWAQALFERARPLLPLHECGGTLCGFNERLRFYRYDVQQQFDWHHDGSVCLDDGRESMLTFMIYLNDGFEGGSTDFRWTSVRPVRGTALVFPHHLMHRGAPVMQGLKYVLRTDVMYFMPDRIAAIGRRERQKIGPLGE